MIPRLVERRHRPPTNDLVLEQLRVFEALVEELGQPRWTFDLVLVEDDAMANLNSKFRSRTSVTDVLSFSYLQEQGEGPCDLSTGVLGAGVDLWVDSLAESPDGDGLTEIGEVVLAPNFITSRCLDQGWSVVEEFPMLVVHGALHLLGWDHMDEKEAEAMRNLEEKFLQSNGLIHPLKSRKGA